MENISKQISYLRGLMDGLDYDDSSKEGRIFECILNVLDEIDASIDDLYDYQDEIAEQVDIIDEDLAAVESEFAEECDCDCCKCDDYDDEDIEYYERMLKQADRNLITAEANKKNAEENLKKERKNYDKTIITVGDLDELDEKIQFCDEVYNASEKLYKDLVVYIHDKLQEFTTTGFQTYHWKKTYKGVDIDDDFNVEFIRKDGTHVSATDPSAGTQLTLALSFITGLNNIAGFKLPIIIDTPLGRLDDDIRYNLGKFLPEYTKDTQVVLLTTGNEYSGDFKRNIIAHVGKTYKLDVIEVDDQEITNVIPLND